MQTTLPVVGKALSRLPTAFFSPFSPTDRSLNRVAASDRTQPFSEDPQSLHFDNARARIGFGGPAWAADPLQWSFRQQGLLAWNADGCPRLMASSAADLLVGLAPGDLE